MNHLIQNIIFQFDELTHRAGTKVRLECGQFWILKANNMNTTFTDLHENVKTNQKILVKKSKNLNFQIIRYWLLQTYFIIGKKNN